ncbi:MAG TPA: aminomethyl-transferring glycine dehydrogenase subunit GcvPA [Candidatus Desulfofervidus auxilii]|uniref:Probable glycine dehydrogenase (decarboxylating) subunit 1 n=1 Tax=Desulfofervidus auxilii TaxID=1621989 RepID=A0A7C0U4C3_DESA2|nr:aminomethyl-transferring glycine dehydrogenase subunit GcvPA [Candidatus Desulfofervidus auxilii]
MSYIPHTQEEVEEMLKIIGVSSIEELFVDIGEELRPKSFNLPEGKSEFEVKEDIKKISQKNNYSLIYFLGGGVYDHYIPAIVDTLSSRSEFYTAYTPYQPECSQGILQTMYEYQTAICILTDMDIANASLYDGGTALCEAVMMALRITERKKIIIDGGINPIYQKMLFTYTANLPLEIIKLPPNIGQADRDKIYKHLDEKTAAIILQNPNFFGTIDDHKDIIEKAHSFGALVIESVYPISLGLIKTPGAMGADIVVGEGQSLGIPLAFGGPYLGFLACKEKFVRKMPGRIVGATVDKEGKRGFVLTLQTREQHIRRQKATSNICTNAALCALRAIIYLSILGKEGFIELAKLNYYKSEFTKKKLREIGIEIINSPTFNEFVVYLKKDANEIAKIMIDKGFVAGLPLGNFYKGMENYLLIAVTEKRKKEEILNFVETLKDAINL